MLTFRSWCTLGLVLTCGAAHAAAQGYPAQGYDPQQQQYPQQQYPQDQQYPQQQYPQDQQQPPPGYFPTPDAQGAYGYQQQMAPGAGYPTGSQAPAYAPAEPLVSSVAKAIQFGAGISVIQYNSLSISQEMMTVPTVPATDPVAAAAAAAAAGPAASAIVTNCCIAKHPLYLEGAYGLSDNMLLGAMIQLASVSETVKDGTSPAKDFVFTLAPKFDWQFSPSSRWNPFLGAAVSVSIQNKTYLGFKDSRTLFGVALRGGLRCFVLDQLSIDPTLSIGGAWGSGKQQNLAMPAVESEYSASNLHFAMSLGLSLWVR